MSDNHADTNVKDVIQIDSELLDNISELIESQSEPNLLTILTDLHPADIAEIINHLNADDAGYLFGLLDTETAGETLLEIDDNLREKILKDIDSGTITEIIDELETDDATDIVSELPQDVAEHVLENIDIEDSTDVKELLKYAEDTAGGLMNSDFVFVQSNSTIKSAIVEVRKHADEFDQIYQLYILENGGKLVGMAPLKVLLTTPLKKKINSVMEEDLIYVTPEIDQEEVANIMKKYDLVSIPVVDEEKKMLGRITIDDVLDVLEEETEEDIQKIAGLSEEQELSDSVFRISRIRLPWLIIALVVELIGVVVLAEYEDVIKQFTIAAFFFPVVMAMGGSSGTQASIVMVRGLTSGDLWLSESIRKLGKEFAVSVLNGIAISSILFVITSLFFEDLEFVTILSLSLLVIIVFATMVGAAIPVLLKRVSIDPAVATGPFVTTMNDVLGLIIYMIFITLFLLP